MEQTSNHGSIPTSPTIDKSRVLDIKPLRQLIPIFPSAQNVSPFSNAQGPAPFVCAGPSGPFPPGATPFYPFFTSHDSQKLNEQNHSQTSNHNAPFGFASPISAAVPISSFRTSQTTSTHYMAAENGGTGSSKRPTRNRNQTQPQNSEEDGFYDSGNSTGRLRSRSLKRNRDDQDINFSLSSQEIDLDSILTEMIKSFNLTMFDTSRRVDGDKEVVGYVLMIHNVLKRKINQIEDSKGEKSGIARRPDLKAVSFLLHKGIRTNVNKRVGAIPGVDIGDIFFFRMEMCLIGLHAPSMAGIDYMGQEEETVAVSIVSSGGYEDDMDDPDVLIYSGQGGNANRKDKESSDQKLERGNLALEKSLHRGNDVRVIRGLKDVANPTGKIYVYDGLYKIRESWIEKSNSGSNVFKYKLRRIPDQPEGFATWKSVQRWKDNSTSRIGVILPDLTSGVESIPVSLVNDVDNEKGPAYFTYSPSLKYPKSVPSMDPSSGCNCIGGCTPSNPNCPCVQKNGGYFPYASNLTMLSHKSLIHECGPACYCPPNCRNRVSQGGIRVRLEVFQTRTKGWGLRSWDPIRAGAFICEYAGEVIDNTKAKDLIGNNEDSYMFDSTRTFLPLEEYPSDPHEPPIFPFPLIIGAQDAGNVARFMNHSCFPNVIWRPVLRERKGEYDLHIAFYAFKHIPPLTELTYDYGVVSKGDLRKKKCLCESVKCRGYF